MPVNEQIRTEREDNVFFVVDDNEFVLTTISNALLKFGRVHSYSNAPEMLENYEKIVPDMVFLDIHLGDQQDGRTFIPDLKALDPAANIHMLSGDSTKENITTSVIGGAKSFIGKPFTQEKLLTALKKCPTLKKVPE